MLSTEDNERVTLTGRGTPMGDVFRRFWIPVLASSDLPERDGAPVRLRVLGENLVAFRDTNGDVGVLDAACPHRRAKLFWGRNEDCGLRCAYHGWKFDVHGQCVDIPSEPPGSAFRDQIHLTSYPAAEAGKLVWVYMGSPAEQPPVPDFEWMHVPADQVRTRSWFQDSNWLQSLEGDIDTAHVSFLHRWLDPDTAPQPDQMIDGYRHFVVADTAPRLFIKETAYGFVYAGRRTVGEDDYYWRVSHWVAPGGSAVPGTVYRPVRFLTPIDDRHAMSLSVSWHEHNRLADDPFGGGSVPLSPVELDDGYVIDARLQQRNRHNDFEIDRAYQKTTKFSGIRGGPGDEDRAVTETMEPIMDRSEEHLGTTDIAIVAMRRGLLRLADRVQQAQGPVVLQAEGPVRFRGVDVRSSSPDFDTVLEEIHEELVGAGER